MSVDRLEELRRRALEIVERMREEERRLIREISERSPNKYMYLGYAPIHLRGYTET